MTSEMRENDNSRRAGTKETNPALLLRGGRGTVRVLLLTFLPQTLQFGFSVQMEIIHGNQGPYGEATFNL